MESFSASTRIRGRLIVLVPEEIENIAGFARRVHWIALRERRDVLYVTLVGDVSTELSAARLLTTLQACTQDGFMNVRTQALLGADWIVALQPVYQAGDQLICHAGQTCKKRRKIVSLEGSLHEHFRSVVVPVSGFYHPVRVESARSGWHVLLFWLGCLVVLALFSWLEIDIDLSLQGALRSGILLVLMLVEAAAVWAWNGITS